MSKKKIIGIIGGIIVVIFILILVYPTSMMNRRLNNLKKIGYKTAPVDWNIYLNNFPPNNLNNYTEITEWDDFLKQAENAKVVWSAAGAGNIFTMFHDKDADMMWFDVPSILGSQVDPNIDYNMIFYYQIE